MYFSVVFACHILVDLAVPDFGTIPRRLVRTISCSAAMSGMDAVLSALQTLYTDPSSAAKEQANRWLQSFQKEVSLASRSSRITYKGRNGKASAKKLIKACIPA